MNRQVIPAIMTSAFLLGTVLVTFTLAFFPGDGQCTLASASEFKLMSQPAQPKIPSGESEDVTKSMSKSTADPFNDCYQTCKIDEAQSEFMKRMCWVSCAYSAYWTPVGP
jgi:hypothetical protein